MKRCQLTVCAANQSHRKLHKTVVDWILDEVDKAGTHGAQSPRSAKSSMPMESPMAHAFSSLLISPLCNGRVARRAGRRIVGDLEARTCAALLHALSDGVWRAWETLVSQSIGCNRASCWLGLGRRRSADESHIASTASRPVRALTAACFAYAAK